ncbi:MAG: hypothetical protein QOD44_4326 [Solirubrobacteraceae bacterium]|jgi:hypothetical protein|nr:hypothetical protein [Solirubrobacteraceae bacterium]MEA2320137.1 hypothetical protein [Solirubrobacteraceae bacterium]
MVSRIPLPAGPAGDAAEAAARPRAGAGVVDIGEPTDSGVRKRRVLAAGAAALAATALVMRSRR